MSRHPTDCYITSPEAAVALKQWWPVLYTAEFLASALIIDPFAGPGTLARWVSQPSNPIVVRELDPRWADELRWRHHVVWCPRDSLQGAWTDDYQYDEALLVTNPPYSRTAEAVALARRFAAAPGHASWLLLREDWFSHPGRPLPHYHLKLRWRPAMGLQLDKRTGKRRPGTDRAGYVWAGWTGPSTGEETTCTLHVLDRPEVPAEWRAEHRRLLEIADAMRAA